MTENFNEILNQLGIELNLILTPDSNGSCALEIDDKLIIQLEIDKTEERVLLGSVVCYLPPGKFRENIFVNTLKANNQIPQNGTFAFNEPSSDLILFQYLPLKNLTAKLLKNKLEQFIEKAMSWKEAIDSGQTMPTDFEIEMRQDKSSIFNPPSMI